MNTVPLSLAELDRELRAELDQAKADFRDASEPYFRIRADERIEVLARVIDQLARVETWR